MDFRFKQDHQVCGIRASALICHENCILAVKYKPGYYAPVGGAIQVGEDSTDAIRREVMEELGTDCTVKELAFIVENQFIEENAHWHTIEFHYLVELEKYQTSYKVVETDGTYSCEWLPLDALDSYDFRPSFLKEELSKWNGTVKHIISKGK